MKSKTLFFGVIFLLSCSAKEFIINNQTNEIVAGYSKKASLRIGMPLECDQAIIETGIKEGLIPQCLEKTGSPSRINLIYAIVNAKWF